MPEFNDNTYFNLFTVGQPIYATVEYWNQNVMYLLNMFLEFCIGIFSRIRRSVETYDLKTLALKMLKI